MSAAIQHRGPDSAGFHVDDRVAFAFTRLAINDLGAGDQPMYDESRQIVAMTTGEIYNYRELRDLLVSRGHTLRTRCDTEVVPHLYEEFGRDFVSRLDGQFAVVLYDHREQLFIGAATTSASRRCSTPTRAASWSSAPRSRPCWSTPRCRAASTSSAWTRCSPCPVW